MYSQTGQADSVYLLRSPITRVDRMAHYERRVGSMNHPLFIMCRAAAATHQTRAAPPPPPRDTTPVAVTGRTARAWGWTRLVVWTLAYTVVGME